MKTGNWNLSKQNFMQVGQKFKKVNASEAKKSFASLVLTNNIKGKKLAQCIVF